MIKFALTTFCTTVFIIVVLLDLKLMLIVVAVAVIAGILMAIISILSVIHAIASRISLRMHSWVETILRLLLLFISFGFIVQGKAQKNK